MPRRFGWILRYQRLKNLVLGVTAAAFFAATFLGQELKLKIVCEKRRIISRRFFGIPPFRFYALADGIKRILARCGPRPQPEQPANLQLELLLAWGTYKMRKVLFILVLEKSSYCLCEARLLPLR